MATDLLGTIDYNVRLADQHILSLGTIINEQVTTKLDKANASLDSLPLQITTSVRSIVQTNSAMMESILTTLQNDISKLSVNINSLNADLASLVTTSINEVIQQLEIATGKITKYQEQLEDLLNNSIDALGTKIDENQESILDQFDGIKIFLQDRFGELTEYVGILHNAMKKYVEEQTKEVISNIEASETRMKSFISDNTNKIIEDAKKNMDEIKTHITTGFETIVQELRDMSEDIILSISNLWLNIRTYLDTILNETPENLLKRIQREYAVASQFNKAFKHPNDIDIKYISPDEG